MRFFLLIVEGVVFMKCLNCGSDKLCYINNSEIDDSYKCDTCGYIYPKNYFFISHSHLDIEKVRIIRNIIEETFFYEPILFFLKSLSEETEIKDLIKREIYERVWFIYCDSENAKNSKYVQFERNYISKLVEDGMYKKIINIDLENTDLTDIKSIESLKEKIRFQIKKTKLFISYHNRYFSVMSKIIELLKEKGYSIFEPKDIVSGESWLETTQSKIKETSYTDGVFICQIDDCYSRHVEFEIMEAIKNNATILPLIFIDKNVKLESNKLLDLLADYNAIYVDKNNNCVEELVDKIIRYIDNL